MGTLHYFPTERFGAVTRATEQPHAVERLAGWLRKSAHIRASASLGCEAMLELAPNVVPLRSRSKSDVMASAVATYCHERRYQGQIVSDAIRVGIMRIKDGHSVASAISAAKTRADFSAKHGHNGPEAAA